MEDFYELLGVSEDATIEEIDRAWRERVRRYHPDVNDDTRANAQFKTLQAAHETLTDEAERAAYDRLGHETYVEDRLDGLPSVRERDDRPTDPAATGDATEARRAGNAGGSTGSTDREADANAGSGRGSAGGRPRADATGPRRTPGGDGTKSGATTGATSASSTRAARGRRHPRRPLAYGWVAVALASAVYLVGLWSYLGPNAGAVSAFVDALATAPVPALTAGQGFVPPGTFVADAAAAGAVPRLLLAVGAGALASSFAAVVVWFGRGTAYLYAVGGVAPLAALGIGPLVTAPDGVVVLLLLAVPAATVLSFLLDVGRALLAMR
jgi:hypothetical protein